MGLPKNSPIFWFIRRIRSINTTDREPVCNLLRTEERVLIHNSTTRVIWSFENCYKVSIEHFGFFPPTGELVILNNFDKMDLVVNAYSFNRQVTQTVLLKTVEAPSLPTGILDIQRMLWKNISSQASARLRLKRRKISVKTGKLSMRQYAFKVNIPDYNP